MGDEEDDEEEENKPLINFAKRRFNGNLKREKGINDLPGMNDPSSKKKKKKKYSQFDMGESSSNRSKGFRELGILRSILRSTVNVSRDVLKFSERGILWSNENAFRDVLMVKEQDGSGKVKQDEQPIPAAYAAATADTETETEIEEDEGANVSQKIIDDTITIKVIINEEDKFIEPTNTI